MSPHIIKQFKRDIDESVNNYNYVKDTKVSVSNKQTGKLHVAGERQD